MEDAKKAVELPTDEQSETVKCPACGNTIRANSILCRHCNSELRAVDLLLPPLNTEPIKKFQVADCDFEEMIKELEEGNRTCCLKIRNDDVLSRAAILLYRGRAVGCVYANKGTPESFITEEALKKAVKDLSLPNTFVSIYDLPDALAGANSALFMGYRVSRGDHYEPRAYMDYIRDWSKSKNATGCILVSLPNGKHHFGYIYLGKFVGSFSVEDQIFTEDDSILQELIKKEDGIQLDVNMLPFELTGSAPSCGHSLRVAFKQMNC
jgi:hypothetical protein